MDGKFRFPSVAIKTVIVHTVTYFIVGFLSSTVFDYGTAYAETALNLLMRPVSHPLVMAGVLFQPLRGLLFGVAFYATAAASRKRSRSGVRSKRASTLSKTMPGPSS